MLHLVLGFLVPLGFLGVGVVGKKLVNHSTSWGWTDAYLGIELTLAAITVTAINACDLYRIGEKADREKEKCMMEAHSDGEMEGARLQCKVHDQTLKDTRQEQGRNTAVLCSAFFGFLFAGILHQAWDSADDDDGRKVLFLAGLANVCGFAPMVCYMLWVKGLS